ncbi:YheC/YheD family endospore coat-associated protein [Salipaludibacillus agaradhaerens]|uniref:YheC/YheD family endospore coat-associated protein n=1 Tax=Salipaludibacillus agaradhaerens TaxID=76935 RepID=UPI000997255C|nr:YheC/YheD family protein [Salipaludibacillus agaradhaerens]
MNIKTIKTEEVDKLYLPKTITISKPELIALEKVTFHFGSRKKELALEFLDELSQNEMGLSHNVKDKMGIPDICFELTIMGDQIRIGPVILYLVSKRLITRLEILKERIEKSVSFDGLILLSTVDGINTDADQIEGYYFQPSTNTEDAQWKEGVFPYPDAIFKRVVTSEEMTEHLYDKTNGRIFNSHYFNKWDMWEWLAPDSFIRRHLPYTQALTSLDDIYQMLDVYECVYLKPKSGSGGKGIIQMKKGQKGTYELTSQKKGLYQIEQLENDPIIDKIIRNKEDYMIQQDVGYLHDTRNVDFRIYMQKNETQEWTCTGLIARFGKPGSVTTNLRNLDYLLEGKEAFRKLFNNSEHDLNQLEKKVKNICSYACELLDQHGCFGDIAIDFILDNSGHVWILEMNKRYGYKSFSIIEDSLLYRKIIRKPFMYASSLAGFHVKDKRKLKKKKQDQLFINTMIKLLNNEPNVKPIVSDSCELVMFGKEIVHYQKSHHKSKEKRTESIH